MLKFTTPEINVLISLLEELKTQQENAGCNDYSVDKTEDNLAFAQILNLYQPQQDLHLTVRENDICGFDLVVTHYFIDKLQRLKKQSI